MSAVPGFITVRFLRPWFSPDHVFYGRKDRTQQVPEQWEEFLPTTAVVLDGGKGAHNKRVDSLRQERGLRPLNTEQLQRLADTDTSAKDHPMMDESGNAVVQRPAPNPIKEQGNNTKQPTMAETIEANAKPSESTDKDAARRAEAQKK